MPGRWLSSGYRLGGTGQRTTPELPQLLTFLTPLPITTRLYPPVMVAASQYLPVDVGLLWGRAVSGESGLGWRWPG